MLILALMGWRIVHGCLPVCRWIADTDVPRPPHAG
jgi:hypothetical protein